MRKEQAQLETATLLIAKYQEMEVKSKLKHINRLFRTGLSVAAVLTSGFVLSAASNPKATGDAQWVNKANNGTQAHTVFNALNTSASGSAAKGSLMYDDGQVTYTMEIRFLKVNGNTARFAGQITATNQVGEAGTVTGICCRVGNWIYYQIRDNAEPGIGVDEMWGGDMGPDVVVDTISKSASAAVAWVTATGEVNQSAPGWISGPFVIYSGNVQVRQ